MENTKSKKIQVAISERELEMITDMEKWTGAGRSELIRELVRDRYQKMFPAYSKSRVADSAILPEITGEEACKLLGGKIDVATQVCKIPFNKDGSYVRGFPVGVLDRQMVNDLLEERKW